MNPSKHSTGLTAHFILFATVLFSVFLLLISPGCNSGSSDTHGSVRILLTDAPASGFDAVNVTIEKIRIHQSRNAPEHDPGWAEIVLDPPRQINLLDLTNGILFELGELPLAAGHYTQLRLVLADNTGNHPANSIIPTGTGTEIPLDTPSAMQSGLKLINEFDVFAGERVDLVLDFNACKSVVMRGNGSYGLKPVIRVLPVIQSGIGGFVTPTGTVMVSAEQNGTVVRSTVPNAQGEFFLSHLEPGSYNVVITADNRATTVITGVTIALPTSSAMISSAAAPITLEESTPHIISGDIDLTLPVPATTTVAEATAKQDLSGTIVTVKSQTIALPDSAYTLTLPAAAPWLGAFGDGTLPISLSVQTAAAGYYTIEAAASGYATQSIDLDPAVTTQDFLLLPTVAP